MSGYSEMAADMEIANIIREYGPERLPELIKESSAAPLSSQPSLEADFTWSDWRKGLARLMVVLLVTFAIVLFIVLVIFLVNRPV